MFGKKPSKTPAADLRMPDKEAAEALSKASGIPLEEIVADASEEPTLKSAPGSCPVCGNKVTQPVCPTDGHSMRG